MNIAPLFLAALLASVPPSGLAQTNRANLDLVRQLNETFVHVAESVSPAVVVITVTPKAPDFSIPGRTPDPEEQDRLRRFHEQFDDPGEGRGSGIIVRKDGFILTNSHVIEDPDRISVRLFDGRTFDAKVRGVDRTSDVAILKIDADDLPVARLGDSSKVRVGEFAIAIGAPFRLDYSVTIGHISAKSRSQVVPAYLGGQNMDQDFIQTDANINPGNSGGPLVNIDGEVVGVNTLIRGISTGIGFAIPINLAKEIGEQLIQTGKFIRPRLGVAIRAFADAEDLRKQLTNITHGVVVREVLPLGPAANSTLQENDVILNIDGTPVATPQQLRNAVRSKKIGQEVTLEVQRAQDRIKVQVVTGADEPDPVNN